MAVKVWPALLCGRDFAQPVGKKAQGALGCDVGVKLADRARCRIAWVDKGFFTFRACGDLGALLVVERLKVIAA